MYKKLLRLKNNFDKPGWLVFRVFFILAVSVFIAYWVSALIINLFRI